MENREQGYIEALIVKIRKEKSETPVVNKIPFSSKGDVWKKMFHAQSLLTEVFCTSESSCGIYCSYKQSCTPNPSTLWHPYVPKII